MRVRTKNSALLLLLVPSLAYGLVAQASGEDDSSLAAASKSRPRLPTKDAPVDGKDGKPHLGPFVDSEGPVDIDHEELPPLKGRPDDPTMFDGKKIPESNDGVMFDKNRARPQDGTTGLEGGVSEKDKARVIHEGQTGEKLVTKPQAPKEQPPLPHSEEEKMNQGKPKASSDKTSDSDSDEDSLSYTGLGKPDDLPNTPHEQPPPMPNTANKDPLDLSSKSKLGSKTSTTTLTEDNDGIQQPFHSFILSLTMILVSEVGDKTFLVAALMAMKHDRMVVFSAAFGALLVMTVLSAVLGHAVPALIPKRLTSFLAAGLFFVFGGRLLKEGMEMDPNEGVGAEMSEVEQELAEKEKEMARGRNGSVSQYNLEMGLNGRRSRSAGRYSSPPRSPSQSPSRSSSSQGISSFVQGAGNLCSLLLSPAWVQTFVMTFLGEWGDRSQIATIAMAAGQDWWFVTLGAIFGHAICTSVAVIGGRAIAGRVSLKVVTVSGAVAFLLFGIIYLIEAFWG